MTQETRNIMLATCLSLLVVLGWDAFYARPHLDKERRPKLKCTRARHLARSRGRKRAIPKPRLRKRPV